jgi:hypothetical protein
MSKDRSDVRVVISIKDRGRAASIFDVTGHVQRPSKFKGTRKLALGSATTRKGAEGVAKKAKAKMIKESKIPAANIRIK